MVLQMRVHDLLEHGGRLRGLHDHADPAAGQVRGQIGCVLYDQRLAAGVREDALDLGMI